MTEKEIRDRYVKWHDRITKQYYVSGTLTKEQFDASHNKCWTDMELELLEEGHTSPPPKQYLLYTKKITTPNRTIYVSSISLENLTLDEITQFETEGYTVEEVTGNEG